MRSPLAYFGPTPQGIRLERGTESWNLKQATLMKVIDERSLLERTYAVVQAGMKLVAMTFQRALVIVKGWFFLSANEKFFIKPVLSGSKYVYPEDRLAWKTDSQGLYLFIHGLRGTPSAWNEYLNKVSQDQPEMDCLAPHVPLGGNCPLEDAAEPLLAVVSNYAQKHPGKPIVLVGTSNGGRIAMYIENNLPVEELKGAKLSLVSIAGVHYGTQLVSRLVWWRLLWVTTLHPKVTEDFHWQSGTSIGYLNVWLKNKTSGTKITQKYVICFVQRWKMSERVPYRAHYLKVVDVLIRYTLEKTISRPCQRHVRTC